MSAVDLENAGALAKKDLPRAMDIYKQIVLKDVQTGDEEAVKVKEQAVMSLGNLLAQEKKADDLGQLIKVTRPFLSQISKPKAAKLVKALVDKFLDIEGQTGTEVQLCQECIDWAKDEKRVYLRQALEARLVALYYETNKYTEALTLGGTLLKELKKLDDKILLVEVQLLESKVYYSLQNLPKARAALTSGRTTANGIYCPPKLQAALDLQSGILHAADERDFKTAFSYFYEAFDSYDSIDSPKAVTGLKYMLLSKIMLELPDEVQQIVSGKVAVKYAGPAVDAMLSIAKASAERSLAQFQETLNKYHEELLGDVIIKSHLDSLYDKLLEQNLCRIIEPFSRVQVAHISKLIALPVDQVERKLSKMILDKKINGILSQGDGVLIMFDESSADKTYEAAISTIQSLGKVVDALYNKAKKLQ